MVEWKTLDLKEMSIYLQTVQCSNSSTLVIMKKEPEMTSIQTTATTPPAAAAMRKRSKVHQINAATISNRRNGMSYVTLLVAQWRHDGRDTTTSLHGNLPSSTTIAILLSYAFALCLSNSSLSKVYKKKNQLLCNSIR